MFTEYRVGAEGKVVAAAVDLAGYGGGAAWLDVLNPDELDMARLGELMGFDVPSRRDMTEIELSNRLYKDNGSLVMIASLIPKDEMRAVPTRPVTFILRRDLLLTVRFCEFYSFDRAAFEITREGGQQTPLAIFNCLLEEAVSDRADSLEYTMRGLETLTSQMFLQKIDAPDNPELDQVLRGIGAMGEMVSNVRESITSLQRVLNFAKAHVPDCWQGPDTVGVIDSLKNDLTALSDEASFIMSKLSFNLDATLGMINLEETKVVRLLSVVTLLLAPPTLIAGIYGMNFDIMPELHWSFGYAFSLGLMAASAAAGIWYLKRKKWF